MTHTNCRFCRETGSRNCQIIRYAKRHYAHVGCVLARKGVEFLLALPSGVLASIEEEELRHHVLRTAIANELFRREQGDTK